MATIVFTAVGSFFGGPIGGAIGGFIGGYIDNQFLFPKDDIQGPRVNDLQITTASEGNPMKWVIGPFNRVAGTMIWKTDLIEDRNTKRVGKGGGPEITEYIYYANFAIALCDTRGLGAQFKIRKIWADADVIYDEDGDTGLYDSLTIYDGTQTAPDPLMESIEGVGNVPNYKSMCYLVFNRLAVVGFGNRIPNITVLVAQYGDVSLGDAYELVLGRAGLQSAEWDVTRLKECFKGVIISGPQEVGSLLKALTATYATTIQEVGDVLTFYTRGSEEIITVAEADLTARDFGSGSAPRPINFNDTNDWELPASATLTFFNYENDQQQGSEIQVRDDFDGANTAVMSTPVTLGSGEARAIARRIIWTAEAERVSVEFTLPPSYSHIHEGDAISVIANGQTYYIFVGQLDRGANGLLRIRGSLLDPDQYTQAETSSTTTDPTTPYRPTDTDGILLDLPALVGDHIDKVGFYWAVALDDSTAKWRGAQLWVSENGTDYTYDDSMLIESPIGKTRDALRDATNLYWDRESSLTVEMTNGTLSSVTEDALLNAGTNRAAVRTETGEWEIIAFQNATQIETGVFVLSKFLRGLRGTNVYSGNHESGADFVLIASDLSLLFNYAELSGLFGSRFYKFPAVQGDLEDYTATAMTLQGFTMKPQPACHMGYSWNSNNDLTVTWTRRSKKMMWPFAPGGGSLANDEDPESYEIDIHGMSANGTLLRTIVSSSTSFTYLATEQTADGGSPGASVIYANIFQISQDVGRGIPNGIRCEPLA